jgi:hypothetical protein
MRRPPLPSFLVTSASISYSAGKSYGTCKRGNSSFGRTRAVTSHRHRPWTASRWGSTSFSRLTSAEGASLGGAFGSVAGTGREEGGSQKNDHQDNRPQNQAGPPSKQQGKPLSGGTRCGRSSFGRGWRQKRRPARFRFSRRVSSARRSPLGGGRQRCSRFHWRLVARLGALRHEFADHRSNRRHHLGP